LHPQNISRKTYKRYKRIVKTLIRTTFRVILYSKCDIVFYIQRETQGKTRGKTRKPRKKPRETQRNHIS